MESTFECACRLPVVLCVEIVQVAFFTVTLVTMFSTSKETENENDDNISTGMTHTSQKKRLNDNVILRTGGRAHATGLGR